MSQSWIHRADLSPSAMLQLRRFVSGERAYYNTLLDGLAGPIRTMPDAIKKFTGRLESLLAIVAATRVELSKIKADNIPAPLAPFADLLFKDGRPALDGKEMIILDLVRKEGAIHPHTRAGMAVEMIRYAIDQIAVLNRTGLTASEDNSYKYSVKMLTPLDERSKRHVQLPRSAVSVVVLGGETMLSIPYLAGPLKIATPQREWNYIILRADDDGRMTVELVKETARYQLRRFDQVSRKKSQSQTSGKVRRAGIN